MSSNIGNKIIFIGNRHLRVRKSNPSGSNLGGEMNEAEIAEEIYLHNAFPMVQESETITGVRDYQGLYILNTHPVVTAKGLVMFSEGTSNSSTSMKFGVDPAGVGDGTTFGVAQVIDNKETTPDGVIWKNGKNRTDPNALVLPDIPKNRAVLVWFERTIPFGIRPAENDNIKIIIDTNNIQGDYGIVDDPGTSIDVITGATAINIDLSWLHRSIRATDLIDHFWFLGNATDGLDASPWINNLVKFNLKNITKFIFGFLDIASFAKRNQFINGVDRLAQFGYQNFRKRNINFTIVDVSGFQKYVEPSTQYNRIDEYLKNASRNSNVDFMVVLAANSPYASEPDNDDDPRIRIDTDFRKHYHPLFEKYGVHLCITAGFHNYQRQDVLGFNEATPDAPSSLLTADRPDYIISAGSKTLEASGTLFLNITSGVRKPIHNIPSPKAYTAFSYLPKGVCGLVLYTKQRTEDTPPILEGRFFDNYEDPGTGNAPSGQGRIKHLVDRFSIAYAE